MACSECGGTTVWDDAAASEICTECGTLTDPGQVVLTSHTYLNDSAQHNALWDPAASTTLKNPRNSWALAGQGQEARDRKNAYTMASFITSLAVSMNASGLSPRAITLFNQAKAIGYFRWGRRAKLVAGACLVIAFRESSRPDSIQDISIMLKSTPQLLSRTFISVTSALQITTNSVDPSVFMPTLQSYLTSTLQGHQHQVESGLPAALLKSIQPFSLHTVTSTATSLCHVLARLCPFDGTSKPPAASTACAVFMLSLEAEARTTLNSLGDLGKFLGARLHIGKGVVMAQYKAIQDQVASLIEQVPWLGKYRSTNGRAKVAKRSVVARGLKDVIKFNEEILRKVLLPELPFETSPVDIEDDQGDESEGDSERPEVELTTDAPPPKRRKLHHSLDEASRFLLNPLGITGPSRSHSKAPSTNSAMTISKFPLTSYVLSTSSLSSISHKPPTRLQLLAAERGGSDEVAIPDDELFLEGELEGFLRDEKEATVLRHTLGWDVESEDDEESTAEKGSAKGKQRSRKGQSKAAQPPKTSRLNMEALARFMQGSDIPLDDDDKEDKEGKEEGNLGLLGLDAAFDGDYDSDNGHVENTVAYEDEDLSVLEENTPTATYSSASSLHGDEEIVLDGWRPASPTGGGMSFDCPYEEEPG